MECKMWRCFLLVATCATAMAAATEADKPLSIEDLEELDDNLEELLSDEDHVVEKRHYPRPSHHEYTAAAAASTAHYGQQRLAGSESQQHQQHHHHHDVQAKTSQLSPRKPLLRRPQEHRGQPTPPQHYHQASSVAGYLPPPSRLSHTPAVVPDLKCVTLSACNVIGTNLLGFYNMSELTAVGTTDLKQSVISCQSLCQSHADCSHFTHYGPTGAIPNTCYLFTECPTQNEHCHDCHTGPKHCAPHYKDCHPIGADYGGTWFCFPELYSTNAPVKHGARCIFQCPQHMTYHVCHDGQWSRQPGEKRCTCPPATPLEGPSGVIQERDEDKDGKILCWPPQNTQLPSNAGTYCIHACHGHPKHEFKCHHGRWSEDPYEMTCHNSRADGYRAILHYGNLHSKKEKREKPAPEAAKREIAKQQRHRPHPTPPPPPPPHLTTHRHHGIPLSKKSYGYKFISDEEAAAAAAAASTEERGEKKNTERENNIAAKGRDETRESHGGKHKEGAKQNVGDTATESAADRDPAPPTMEKLAKLPIKDAVRVAIRYKLLDHLPELEGSPLAEWGKGGVDADVKAALSYTLYDHPLLGNRDAAASHHVGPSPTSQHHLPVAGQDYYPEDDLSFRYQLLDQMGKRIREKGIQALEPAQKTTSPPRAYSYPPPPPDKPRLSYEKGTVTMVYPTAAPPAPTHHASAPPPRPPLPPVPAAYKAAAADYVEQYRKSKYSSHPTKLHPQYSYNPEVHNTPNNYHQGFFDGRQHSYTHLNLTLNFH